MGHLRKGVDVLREALAAITELAIGAGDVGVRVVDVARKQHAGVDLRPVAAHLLDVFLRRIEVGDLVGAEHVVDVLRELGLERTHHRELLAGEHLDEEIDRAREHHRLFLEVLDVRALREKLGHVADMVSGLAREKVARAGQDRGAHEHRHVGKVRDEFLHEREVLRAVVLRGHVDLQEGDVDLREVVVVPFRRIAHEYLAVLVVFLQPGLQRPADETAADYSDFDHFITFLKQRSAPVGYAAEYLISSLSDVLATIALTHSVTYLLRGVNGETLALHQSQPNHAVRHISQYVQNSPPAVVRGIKQFPLAMIGITFDSQLQLSAHSSRHKAFRLLP